MCQPLHIPFKEDPNIAQAKMNWLAIERWADHIVNCCCGGGGVGILEPIVGCGTIEYNTGGFKVLLFSMTKETVGGGDNTIELWIDGSMVDSITIPSGTPGSYTHVINQEVSGSLKLVTGGLDFSNTIWLTTDDPNIDSSLFTAWTGCA